MGRWFPLLPSSSTRWGGCLGVALSHGSYPKGRIVVAPKDEVKHPTEVASNAMPLGGCQSQCSDGEVVPIMWSLARPIDRVTTVALTPYDPQIIMGRPIRAARPSGNRQREHHRVWPRVFVKRDLVSLPKIRRCSCGTRHQKLPERVSTVWGGSKADLTAG